MKALLSLSKMFFTLSVFFLFQSCYNSDVPLTENGEPIPKKTLGVWYVEDDYNSKAYRTKYVITNGEDNKLIINKYEYKDDKWEGEAYVGHISKVKNALFLNLQTIDKSEEDESESGRYSFCKIKFDGGITQLDFITSDVLETFTTSEELYDYVADNMNNPFFYDSDYRVRLIRSEDVE